MVRQSFSGILEDLDGEHDSAKWGALNRDFHQCLYAPAQRPQLLALITTQHRRFDRYMRIGLAAMQHQNQSQAEHHTLLDACQQRNGAIAVHVLEQHIARAARLLVEQLQPGLTNSV